MSSVKMWFSVNLGLICFKNSKVLKNSVLKSSLIPISIGGVTKTQVLSKSSDNKNLGHSTILWQDGSDMQELPVIVRKIRGKEVMMLYKDNDSNDSNSKSTSEDSSNDDPSNNSSPSAEYMQYDFSSCLSVPEVFKYLETIPAEEVQPAIACGALRRIVNLENNKTFRNRSMRLTGNKPKENFTRTALFNQLVEIIVDKASNAVLLETLRILDRDNLKKNEEKYINILSDEVLIRAADGKFNISQICEIIQIFSTLSDGRHVDKLWIAIAEDSESINEENIMDVFRTLLYFKDSQTVILNILEKKLPQFWSYFSGSNIAEILSIFVTTSLSPGKILSSITKWIHMNMESVLVQDIIEILNNLQALDFNHKTVTSALENIVTNRSDISRNELLITSIANYCFYFRVKSPKLLKCCAEFITAYGRDLSPSTLKTIFWPIGYLNYHPENGLEFWKVVETAFNEKFIQFCPEDILEILLNCIYLEKYPLNFSQKIFNPFFLDRLHSTSDIELIEKMRSKLKVLDCVMNLECKHYQGPLLPNDRSLKKVWIDPRIKKALNQINVILNATLTNFQQLSMSVYLPQLPTVDLFMIDAFIHSKDTSGSTALKLKKNSCAILIHPPEHYCFQSNELIGSQVMRKRVFKRLGLKVVSLDYSRLAVLNIYPKKLFEYINSNLNSPESSSH